MPQQARRPSPFVRRTEELAALSDAFEAARHALVPVLISGDSGIGKTRLAREFTDARRAEGVEVHWGRCIEGNGSPPFWPWAQVLRSLGGPSAADLQRSLAGQETDRFAAFEAVAEVLRAGAAAPRVIVLDDLHVADLATLELLRFLTRAIAEVPLLVIGTHRSHEVRQDAARDALLGQVARTGRRIEPGALDRDAVATLLELAGADPVAPAVVDEVLARSGGNALYVDELVQAIVGRGPAALAEIPAGVRAAVRARVAPLSSATRAALEAAAVVGTRIDPRVLAHLLGLSPAELLGALQPALDVGLVVQGDAGLLDFSHALVREALEESLPAPTRAGLHVAAAGALAHVHGSGVDSQPAAIAEHLRAAGAAADPSDGARWAALAAERARSLFAPEEEAQWWEQASRWYRECGLAAEAGDALFRAAASWHGVGRADRAIDVAERLLAMARADGSGPLLARAVLARTSVWDATQDIQGPPLLAEALAHPDNQAPTLVRAELLCDLASILGMPSIDGRPRDGDGARRALAEVLELIDRHGVPAEVLVTEVLLTIEHGPDRHADRQRWLAELSAADHRRDVTARMTQAYWATSLAFEAGDLAAAARATEEWQRAADLASSAYARWRVGMAKASLAHTRGLVAEAEERAQQALAHASGLHEAMAQRVVAGLVMSIRFDQGRFEEIASAFTEQQLDLLAVLVPLSRADVDGAARLLEPLAEEARRTSPRELHWLCLMSLVARAAALVQDEDRCRWALTELEPYADQCVMWGRSYVFGGPVRELLGLLHRALGQRAEAAAAARATIAWADGAGAPGHAARARLILAAVLDDHDPELPTVLQRARSDAVRLGLGALVIEADARRGALGAAGGAAPPAPAEPSVEPVPAPGLRPTLCTLGGFSLVPAGSDEPARWSSKKARDALKILVCRRGRSIPREELIDLLWPEVDITVGRSRLSVVLSIVRTAFDPEKRRPPDHAVRADRGSVALRLEHVDVDVERFLRLTEAGLGRLAAGHHESAHAVLSAAVDDAWGGPFLAEDRYEDWSTGMRRVVDAAYVAAVRALAKMAEDAEDLAEAADRYAQLVDHDPYDLAAHRARIAVLDAAGRPGEARRQRESFDTRARELGLEVPDA